MIKAKLPRRFKIGLIVLIVAGVVTMGLFVDVVGRIRSMVKGDKETEEKAFTPPKAPEFFPPIPKDTKVLEVFIDDTGLAYVDFSNPIAANHPGGMLNEQATVYSIVNSLTYNLPEIRQVKILVGGAEKETLAGHVLLLPLEMDLSLSNATAPPQEQAPHAN